MNQSNCAIIIPSCDAFEDVWHPFFKLFFKYWPDCPFPVYLISESKKYNDPRVINITLGVDKKWATNTKKALDIIKCDYVIYLQEDYFLMSKVNTRRILDCIEEFKKNDIGYIRLIALPKPKLIWEKNKDFGVIDKNDDYSVSLQATLWDANFFKSLIIEGESGWDMEIKGSKRLSDVKKIFLSVWPNDPAIDYFATAIKKGWWLLDATWLLKREGISIRDDREVESFVHYLLRVSGLGSLLDLIKRVWRKTYNKNK